jgi:FSR family fosmidomycin resistance protein-like MFS transporter
MKIARPLPLVALLGVGHAVSDGTAGLLIGHLTAIVPVAEVGALLLLYNALAFAAQPAIGLLVDRVRRPREAVFVSLGLMGSALLIVDQPLLAVILAGLASAFFHVGGGSITITVTPDRATGLGVFAAPGVIGLACGTALAVTDHFNPEVFLMLLTLVGVGFGLLSRSISIERSQPETPGFEDHDLIVVALLTAIAWRSALWSAFEWVLAGNLPLLLLAASAAGVGKLIGGALADRLGWRRWTIGALAIAAPLLVIGPGNVVTFLIGLALLQSVTPVALATVAKMLPGRPGVAAGLSFGLPIAVGGLFVFGGLGPFIAAPPVTVSLIAGIGAVMWWALRRGKIEPTAPKSGYGLAGDN